MGFWHLALIVLLITWTACVFLRAVAARMHLLRLQLVPPVEEPYESTGKLSGPASAIDEPPVMVAVVSKQPGKNGQARPSGNGKPGSNGNGHGKMPVKRPGR